VKEEVLVPFRAPPGSVPLVTRVRSTLITSSVQALRRRGHEAAYFARLSPDHAKEVSGLIAGVWLPLGLAMAHYGAIDALPLTATERLEMGNEVSTQVQASVLATFARAATNVGVTPWTGLSQFQRLYDRLMDGGACAVTRVGPKEARVEVVQNALVGISYFRTAFRGFIVASCELFTKKVYGYDIARLCSPTTVGYRLAWA